MPTRKRSTPKEIAIVMHVTTDHGEVTVSPTEAFVAPGEEVRWRLWAHRGDPGAFPHERRDFRKSRGELVLTFESEAPFGHRILRGRNGMAVAKASGPSGPHHYKLVAAHRDQVAAVMHCPSIVIKNK